MLMKFPQPAESPGLTFLGPRFPTGKAGTEALTVSSVSFTFKNQVTIRRAIGKPQGAQRSPRANGDTEPNKKLLAASASPGCRGGDHLGSLCSQRGC